MTRDVVKISSLVRTACLSTPNIGTGQRAQRNVIWHFPKSKCACSCRWLVNGKFRRGGYLIARKCYKVSHFMCFILWLFIVILRSYEAISVMIKTLSPRVVNTYIIYILCTRIRSTGCRPKIYKIPRFHTKCQICFGQSKNMICCINH